MSERPCKDYTVKEGDTLESISQQMYNNSSYWKGIYADNRDVIGDDPNQLEPGMVLKICRLDWNPDQPR